MATQVTAESVRKAVDSAITGTKTARDRVQKAIRYILIHAEQHGDYSEAQRLVDETVGLNRGAIVKFFVELGGLEVDGNQFVGWKGAKHIRDNRTKISKTKWWEFKIDKPFEGYDLAAEIDRVIGKAVNMQKTAANDPAKATSIKVDSELLDGLRQLAS